MKNQLIALFLILATTGIMAQDAGRFRARWGKLVIEGGALAPRVTITSPSLEPVITVNDPTLVLSGTAESTSTAPLTEVTWENTTTAASGSANGLGEWVTTSAASASTVVLDTMGGSSTIPLSSTVADTTGGQWSEAVNTTSGASVIYRRSSGYAHPSPSVTSGGSPRMINLATPVPAIAGTSYDVSVRLAHDTALGNDDGSAIIFGYQDANNYCAVFWYGAAASTDAYLLKRVAGVLTTLDSDDITPAINDVMSIEVRGTGLTVKRNGSSVLTATDSDCDNAVGVGIGFGALRDVATDDAITTARLDDFTVIDQDGSNAAITLAEGLNVITVTACDSQAIPVCGSDTIHVTYETSDTTDPVVTIRQPTTNANYNTPAALVVVSGDTTDNTAVTAVTYACSGATTVGSTAATFTAPDWSFNVTVNTGTTTCTVTAADAAANTGMDAIVIEYQPGDSTDPTIAITTTSPLATTVPSVTITGTAADTGGSGLSSVQWTCDACAGGTAIGTSNWTANATVALGANILSFTALDGAGNESAVVTITVNYNPGTLTITTTTLPNGRENDAYPSTTLTSTGGTAPFTWSNNGAGTSLNDADAECAGLVVSSAGVVSGTPTADGTCNWTAKITDNSAVTDTQALSIVIAAAGATGPHDYFTSMIARGDCWKAFSFRPLAGETAPITTCAQSRLSTQLLGTALGGFAETRSRPYTTTYCPTGSEPNCSIADSDPQKQDAAKLVLPMWISYEGRTLAGAIDASQTTITLSAPMTIVAGAGVKIDNEIMRFPSGSTYTSATPVVQRGAFGTTAAAHSSGAAVARNNNINYNQIFLPLNTTGTEDATYLFVWDTYPTDSWIANRHGLTVHKTFHFNSSAGDDNWFRADMGYIPYSPEDGVDGIFNPNSDVGVVRGRRLFNPIYPPSPLADMHEPMLPWGANGRAAIVKPNTWGRWFLYFETQAEGVAANFTTVTTINAAISSTSATTITISCPVADFGPNCPAFIDKQVVGGASWPGRSIKIDDEIMTVSAGVSTGDTTTLTVVRGAYGTTAATHLIGANVGVVHDYITMWYADENNEAVELLDRYPAHLDENHATVSIRGALLRLRVEVSTSTDTILQKRIDAGQQDLVMYLRNFVFLKNPPADWSALRVKPVR